MRPLTRRVSPAVIQIRVTGYAAPDDDQKDSEHVSSKRTSGSGIVAYPDGHVMTNAHFD